MSEKTSRQLRAIIRAIHSPCEMDFGHGLRPELQGLPVDNRYYISYKGQIRVRPDIMRSLMQSIKRDTTRNYTNFYFTFKKEVIDAST